MPEKPSREELMKQVAALEKQLAGLRSERELAAGRLQQAKLARAVEKYKTLLHAFPLGVTVSDDRGNIVETNDMAEQLLGVARPEHERRSLDGPEWRIIRPDGSAMPPCEWPSVIALREKRTVSNCEMGIVRPGEDVVWINVTAAPLHLEGYGVVVAYSDITEKRHYEQELREKESLFRRFFENSGVFCYQVSPQGRILEVNQTALDALGYTRADLVGHPLAGLYAEESLDEVKRAFHAWESTGRVQGVELAVKTKTGDRRWVILNADAVRDEAGRIVHSTSVQVDITERKRAEDALEKSIIKFKTVADFTYDWEFWTAPDGQYLYVSPSCRRITGYGPEDFLKDPGLIEKITHPEDLSQVRLHHVQAHESDHPLSIAFRIITRGGEQRWIGHICQPVHDDGGRCLGRRGSNRDITEQKNLEQYSLEMQKMQAIGALAGGVAHQFNNALCVVSGNLQLLEEDFAGNETVGAYARDMRVSAEHMQHLTSQLLAYARCGKYYEKILSLAAFVTEALPIIHYQTDSGITINTQFDDGVFVVKADPTQLQMMLSSVLVNAMEAMDGKGVVSIRLQGVRGDGLNGEFPELKPGGYACLTVSDHGAGMDEQTLSRIFEPFFTTKFKGRGLGMAATYGIVKNHHGAISVRSQPGQGTSVSIYLPLVERDAGNRAAG